MKKDAQWNRMYKYRSSFIGFFVSLLLVSACAQTKPSPLEENTDTGSILPQEDSNEEDAPPTGESLEIEQEATTKARVTLLSGGTILIGDESNPHRLKIFLDTECAYCRQFVVSDLPWITHEFVDTNKWTIERRFVPMTEAGNQNALFHLCATEQGKYEEADQWLVTHTTTRSTSAQFAKTLGLQPARFSTCLLRPDLQKDSADKSTTRVPSFSIGDTSWVGLITREEWKEILENE